MNIMNKMIDDLAEKIDVKTIASNVYNKKALDRLQKLSKSMIHHTVTDAYTLGRQQAIRDLMSEFIMVVENGNKPLSKDKDIKVVIKFLEKFYKDMVGSWCYIEEI